jgi:hypothetical protein
MKLATTGNYLQQRAAVRRAELPLLNNQDLVDFGSEDTANCV